MSREWGRVVGQLVRPTGFDGGELARLCEKAISDAAASEATGRVRIILTHMPEVRGPMLEIWSVAWYSREEDDQEGIQ